MRLLLCFTCLFCVCSANSQNRNNRLPRKIPAVVKTAFEREFPNKKASWTNEDTGFEAEFSLNGAEASATYDENGHRKELEVEIKKQELPQAVLNYLKQNYPSKKIDEIAKITNDKNIVIYETEIKIDGKSRDLLFDANGKFVK